MSCWGPPCKTDEIRLGLHVPLSTFGIDFGVCLSFFFFFYSAAVSVSQHPHMGTRHGHGSEHRRETARLTAPRTENDLDSKHQQP